MFNILCGSFSRNGTRYVIGGSDNLVRVWNLEPVLARQPVQTPEILKGHTGQVPLYSRLS